MTEKEKQFLKPRVGEVDQLEKKRLIDEALDRRLKATHQFYFFSLKAARERWGNGGYISSAIFNGKRRAYTHITFTKDAPESFDDFKYIGSAKIKDKYLEMYHGISQKMFDAGILFVPPKPTTEIITRPDPMNRLYPPGRPVETEIGENIFEEDD